MRNNRRLLLKIRIPTRMILVVMRIDNEPHRQCGDAFQRRLDLVRQWRILIVHYHNAVFAHRRSDVPAGALQHEHVSGHLRDLDLNFAEILILGGS